MIVHTEEEMAHIMFFGNSAEFSAQVNEIRSYLNEVHKYIEVRQCQQIKVATYSKIQIRQSIKMHQ